MNDRAFRIVAEQSEESAAVDEISTKGADEEVSSALSVRAKYLQKLKNKTSMGNSDRTDHMSKRCNLLTLTMPPQSRSVNLCLTGTPQIKTR